MVLDITFVQNGTGLNQDIRRTAPQCLEAGLQIVVMAHAQLQVRVSLGQILHGRLQIGFLHMGAVADVHTAADFFFLAAQVWQA